MKRRNLIGARVDPMEWPFILFSIMVGSWWLMKQMITLTDIKYAIYSLHEMDISMFAYCERLSGGKFANFSFLLVQRLNCCGQTVLDLLHNILKLKMKHTKKRCL